MDLVTGGAGFLGSHLVDRLLTEQRKVRVLDWCQGAPGDPPERQDEVVDRWGRAVDVRRVDVRAREEVLAALEGVDRVFHLAARPGVRYSLVDPEGYMDVNVRGTAVLLGAMEQMRVKRLVFASSSSVYGDHRAPSTEDDTSDPISPYAATKVAGEALVGVWHHQTGGSVTILRPFTVYGPRQRPGMAVRRFIEAALVGRPITLFGNGSSSRDYTWVGDAIEAIVRAARLEGKHVVNVGTGVPTSLRDLVDLVATVTGRSPSVECVPHQSGDPHHTRANIDRASTVLEWVPRVSLKDGIERTARWVEGSL